MLSIGLTTRIGPGGPVNASRASLAGLGQLRQTVARVVHLALQAGDNIIGIDVGTRALGLVSRAQATGNEVCLETSALDTGAHCRLDELREALAVGEHRFDLGQELRLDRNGRNAGALHGYKVSQLRHMVQPGIDTADHADLVNPIDKIGAQGSPAHEPQQLQGGNGSEASGAARQGTHVHAADVVRDD